MFFNQHRWRIYTECESVTILWPNFRCRCSGVYFALSFVHEGNVFRCYGYQVAGYRRQYGVQCMKWTEKNTEPKWCEILMSKRDFFSTENPSREVIEFWKIWCWSELGKFEKMFPLYCELWSLSTRFFGHESNNMCSICSHNRWITQHDLYRLTIQVIKRLDDLPFSWHFTDNCDSKYQFYRRNPQIKYKNYSFICCDNSFILSKKGMLHIS